MNRLLDPVAAATTPNTKASPNGAGPGPPIANGPNGDTQASGPPQPAASGRDARGRFTKDNPGGPGNPFARQSAALRKRVQAKLTDEKLDKIVDTLIQEAEDGNVAAAKLLLSYGIGQPTPAADPDSLDLQEWKVLRQQVKVREVGEFLNTFPIDEMCEFLSELKPIRSKQWKRPLQRIFIEEGWDKPEHFAGLPGGPPIVNRSNGAEVQTPRNEAARRKQLKKKYAIKAGKLVQRTD